MSNPDHNTKIAYIGPSGAGLGFSLSGITVKECSSGEEMLITVRQLKNEGEHGIIFIDENLAEHYLEQIGKLNEDSLPAILLLPNPVNPKNVAAASLKRLIVKAVGSDIFSEKK